MQLIHLNANTIINEPLVITIGQFDGIHKAHQALINKTIEVSKLHNAKSAIITFNPHIDTVLKHLDNNDYIVDLDSKKEILEQMNVDYLLIIDFNDVVSKISHDKFFEIYINNLNVLEFIVGFDFTYGYLGLGNYSTICDDYKKSVTVTKISKLEIENEKIGSIEIKRALKEGNIKKANELLGYNFFMKFTVTSINNNETVLTSSNINILNKQFYNISINNTPYILNNDNITCIMNCSNFRIGDTIKVIFN